MLAFVHKFWSGHKELSIFLVLTGFVVVTFYGIGISIALLGKLACPGISENAVQIQDSSYYILDNQIYTIFKGEQKDYGWSGCGNTLLYIESADPESFSIINRIYGKDKNRVFFGNIEISADPLTATNIDSSDDVQYIKDSVSVYYRLQKIEGIDPNSVSFHTLGRTNFIKDKNLIAYEGVVIEGADPDTFVLLKRRIHESGLAGLDELLVGDKDQVWKIKYGRASLIPNADPQTIDF